MIKAYDFEVEFKVRDYECDMAGIVNNSVYLNYLEHARHEFISAMGLDFQALYKAGVYVVVVHADLSYKTPLKSGDTFVVKMRLEHSGVRYIFNQDIYRLPDNTCTLYEAHGILCLKGVITTTSLINGRPSTTDEIVNAIKNVVAKRSHV